jgi:tetratricopeptide (TPR) repeat protein
MNNLRERGDAYAQAGQWSLALADYSAALEARPNDPELLHLRGKCYLQLGQTGSAEADFSRALALKPNFPQVYITQGTALCDKGDVPGAIAAIQKAIALEPGVAEFHYELGKVLVARDDLAGAIAAFQKAFALDPAYAAAQYALGNALLRKADLSAARAAFQKAIDCKPDFAEAYCYLGHTLRQQGELGQALEALRRGHEIGSRRPDWKHPSLQWVRQCERLIELDKQLPGFLDGTTLPANVNEQIELAELCCSKRRYRAAVRFYEEAFPRQPKFVADDRYNAACAAAQAGSGRGEDAANLNDGEREQLRSQALDLLTTVLTQFAKEATSALLQKELRYWQVDPDLAPVRESAQLAKLPPKEQEAWRRLWMEVTEGLKGDLSVYRLAVQLDPAWVPGHVRLVNALRTKGDQVDAIAALQKAHALAPNDHWITDVLAWLLAICPDPKVRDAKQAVALAKRAVDAAPNETWYWRTLGVAHFYAGDHQAAVEALTRALQLAKSAEAFDYFPLAMAHQQLGQKEEAKKWYEQGMSWMAANKQHPFVAELALLRADAEALLGIQNPSPDKMSPEKKE